MRARQRLYVLVRSRPKTTTVHSAEREALECAALAQTFDRVHLLDARIVDNKQEKQEMGESINEES